MLFTFIFILPLFIFFILNFFGHLLGYRGSAFFSGFFYIFLIFLIFTLFLDYLTSFNSIFLNFGLWLNSGNLFVDWFFSLDSLSISMLILVISVSSVVNLYSLNYMYNDSKQIKFLSYLSLFTFFMFILITSSNLCVLLLGWEGVGICSFLLISFWNQRITANKAALKAILFNRVGDIFFFIALSLIFFFIQALDLYVIYSYLPFFYTTEILSYFSYSISLLDFIFFFIFGGVVGKSAQLGLHVWLLDAMEGPTPVSALIHAATMVTAGVYLLIRFSFILEYAFFIKIFISIIGIFTAFVSSLIGLLQNDLKSIVAYSTCSQLGYMVAICGTSGYIISFFHLFNHGFFKALLFLSSGVIIHNFLEEQDIRKMGGLFYIFPITYAFFILGSASLIGVPFLSGFYSKDFLLEFLFVLPFSWCNFVFHLGLFSVFFTFFYSIRLLYYVFVTNPNGFFLNYKISRESYSLPMLISLFFLGLGSIFSGYILKDIFLGLGSNFFFDSVFNLFNLNKWFVFIEFFFLQSFGLWFSFKLLPIYIMCISFSIFYFIIIKDNVFLNIILHNKLYFYAYSFFYGAFFFNYFYINIILNFFWRLCFEFVLIDRLLFENFILIQNFFFLKLSYAINNLHQTRFFLNYINYIYFILFFFTLYFLLLS